MRNDDPPADGAEGAVADGSGVTVAVTCLGCGCHCDDLEVRVQGRRVVEARGAGDCALGRRWFIDASRENVDAPAATVGGLAVPVGEALSRGAEALGRARGLVVWGLTGTTTEAVREALAVADRLGARVLPARDAGGLARVDAYQAGGRVSATLGEVKNRADLLVYWGADPVTTHPRHGERYSWAAAGRFVEGGRAGRRVVVVDGAPNRTAAEADLFLPIPADRQADALAALRVMVRGGAVDDRGGVGLDLDALRSLAGDLLKANYGAWFLGPAADPSAWAGAGGLVDDLNDRTRFVLLGLGEAGNPAGADAALVWQGGFLPGLDYRKGWPGPLDPGTTLEGLLRRGEVDAVLGVAGGFPDGLSDAARAVLDGMPSLLIGPGATAAAPAGPGAVAVDAAVPGLDVRGTVVRCDGVTLPMRPVRGARLPEDRVVLRELARLLGPSLAARGGGLAV